MKHSSELECHTHLFYHAEWGVVIRIQTKNLEFNWVKWFKENKQARTNMKAAFRASYPDK